MISPARLHVLFARDAPVGVIFRRGPSKQVRLILWHTDTDTFAPGQWLKGRIFEAYADLSPDGKLLAYFAMDHRARRQRTPDSRANWIAVSRPPYLTALALWFTGWGTYGGDTFFADNQTLILSEDAVQPAPGHEPPSHFFVCKKPYSGVYSGVCNGIPWDERTSRGWHRPPQTVVDASTVPTAYVSRVKPLADGGLVLEDHPFTGKPQARGMHDWAFDQKFWLRNDDGVSVRLDAEHAEVDPAGRLILLRQGKVLAASVDHGFRITTTELADFNAMTFEPIPPPEWATQWP